MQKLFHEYRWGFRTLRFQAGMHSRNPVITSQKVISISIRSWQKLWHISHTLHSSIKSKNSCLLHFCYGLAGNYCHLLLMYTAIALTLRRLMSYTGCPRRKGPNFGRVFLRSNYTDITQNTYIQSSMVTEILAREVWNFDSYYSLIDYQIHIETGRNMWFL